MPGKKSAGSDRDWLEIAFDTWVLGAEAAMVVGLRGVKLLSGGDSACSEARLMITEKIESNMTLGNALLSGNLGHSPKAVLGGTVSHYLEGVRANRRRLSGR